MACRQTRKAERASAVATSKIHKRERRQDGGRVRKGARKATTSPSPDPTPEPYVVDSLFLSPEPSLKPSPEASPEPASADSSPEPTSSRPSSSRSSPSPPPIPDLRVILVSKPIEGQSSKTKAMYVFPSYTPSSHQLTLPSQTLTPFAAQEAAFRVRDRLAELYRLRTMRVRKYQRAQLLSQIKVPTVEEIQDTWSALFGIRMTISEAEAIQGNLPKASHLLLAAPASYMERVRYLQAEMPEAVRRAEEKFEADQKKLGEIGSEEEV
ncbi:hypothetical protein BT63DRAFT_179414 [Microthyrium microscopicum]|uniref:Uncharacterized protein n=1 Tax=Microthyrium microscopicum TaxID=703497 RepID=A0A6A6UHL2_9PEZI|nr:hypothetical protein BT63DRAFT_179414 [Microthyrium microscopicum]